MSKAHAFIEQHNQLDASDRASNNPDYAALLASLLADNNGKTVDDSSSRSIHQFDDGSQAVTKADAEREAFIASLFSNDEVDSPDGDEESEDESEDIED